jgi:hypothetical protein
MAIIMFVSHNWRYKLYNLLEQLYLKRIKYRGQVKLINKERHMALWEFQFVLLTYSRLVCQVTYHDCLQNSAPIFKEFPQELL